MLFINCNKARMLTDSALGLCEDLVRFLLNLPALYINRQISSQSVVLTSCTGAMNEAWLVNRWTSPEITSIWCIHVRVSARNIPKLNIKDFNIWPITIITKSFKQNKISLNTETTFCSQQIKQTFVTFKKITLCNKTTFLIQLCQGFHLIESTNHRRWSFTLFHQHSLFFVGISDMTAEESNHDFCWKGMMIDSDDMIWL